MKEEDKQIVEVAKGAWPDDVMVQELVTIIDCLDQQLAEIREAGEPIEKIVPHIDARKSDHVILLTAKEKISETGIYVYHLRVGDIRRLAEKLKEE